MLFYSIALIRVTRNIVKLSVGFPTKRSHSNFDLAPYTVIQQQKDFYKPCKESFLQQPLTKYVSCPSLVNTWNHLAVL